MPDRIRPVYFIGAVDHYEKKPLDELLRNGTSNFIDHLEGRFLFTVFEAMRENASALRELDAQLKDARGALDREKAMRADELAGRKTAPMSLRSVLVCVADRIHSAHESGIRDREDAIDDLLTARDALMSADKAHPVGYFTAAKRLYEVRQLLENEELPSNFLRGELHYRIPAPQGAALPEPAKRLFSEAAARSATRIAS